MQSWPLKNGRKVIELSENDHFRKKIVRSRCINKMNWKTCRGETRKRSGTRCANAVHFHPPLHSQGGERSISWLFDMLGAFGRRKIWENEESFEVDFFCFQKMNTPSFRIP